MNDQDRQVCELICSLPLFKGVSSDQIDALLSSGTIKRAVYSQGDVVCSPECDEKKLVIFISGAAEVFSADEGRNLLLRRFFKGGIVGVANLFSPQSFVSRVIATKKCETAEICVQDFGKMLESIPSLLYNYLEFLSGKICYLNKKIVTLTAGSAERRLATYLSACADESDSDTFTLPVPLNALAEMLNLGRASLYRAFDKLEADGYVSKSGKTVTLLNRDLDPNAY